MSKNKDVRKSSTVELSERYSKALTRYLAEVNKASADRPYPTEPLTAAFLIECALRQFWYSNRRDLPDLIAFNTVTEVRRG